jgi:NADPH:quinone reductase-like Zn-dependent oxidoreductase
MKAIALDQFGGPEVLHLKEIPVPQPGAGQIRVRVHAAGVNAYDGKLRSGAMESMFATALPAVLGLELAGVVDAVGEHVTDVVVADRVFGWAVGKPGSYAELALSRVYAKIPDGLDFVTAATLPVSGETATRVLDLLALQPGETLLLHGASGAVGEVAAQLALQRGATVIGTGSAENQDRIRALGALPTTYGPGLVERVRVLAPQGIDAVFDASGRGALPDSIELRGGTSDRIVTIADPAARGLGIVFSGGADNSGFDLSGIAAQRADGELTTTVGATYSFDEAAKAHEVIDGGHAGGKVVLVP